MEAEQGDAVVTMDFSELQGMLLPILDSVLQHSPSTSKLDGAAVTDQLTQRALARLWKLIHDSSDDRAGHLAGVPLPEVDAELLPLQQEVDTALARLSARRLAVPAVVEAATRAKLAAQRPAPEEGADLGAASRGGDRNMAEAAGGDDAHGEGAGAGAGTGMGAPEELLTRATATTDRLPAIRARLDEALHRLHSNLAVLGDDGGAPRGSPRTVEKAMLRASRVPQPAAAAAGASAAPRGSGAADGGGGGGMDHGAGESGADATRRCLARELA